MFSQYDVFFDEANQCYQLRTKSNTYLVEFDEEVKRNIFSDLLEMNSQGGHTTEGIIKMLKKKYDESTVIDVMASLVDHGLMPFDPLLGISSKARMNGNGNGHTDGNASEPALKEGEIKKIISTDAVVSVIGKGPLPDIITRHLGWASFTSVKQNDPEEILKDKSGKLLEGLMKKTDFFVVDGGAWNPYFLSIFNVKAIEHQKPWLYVGGIEGLQLKVGPLFYGKETGCYECLTSRVKSNHEHSKYLCTYETFLRDSQSSSRRDTLPHEDVFNHIIAGFCASEITKFFEHWHIPVTWKSYISFDITTYETTRHRLLKVPYCEVCKPELLYNPAPWLESISLK